MGGAAEARSSRAVSGPRGREMGPAYVVEVPGRRWPQFPGEGHKLGMRGNHGGRGEWPAGTTRDFEGRSEKKKKEKAHTGPT